MRKLLSYQSKMDAIWSTTRIPVLAPAWSSIRQNVPLFEVNVECRVFPTPLKDFAYRETGLLAVEGKGWAGDASFIQSRTKSSPCWEGLCCG